ncbi:hypothetical protein IQ07DRAFT_427024 [Pyrenochaeta sp. DS3sAY3a]|nr:hypothetical protein IQ07DRAFT_427024 [Pyrenochaeta sp. DS3sAY3a]
MVPDLVLLTDLRKALVERWGSVTGWMDVSREIQGRAGTCGYAAEGGPARLVVLVALVCNSAHYLLQPS